MSLAPVGAPLCSTLWAGGPAAYLALNRSDVPMTPDERGEDDADEPVRAPTTLPAGNTTALLYRAVNAPAP